ncbi:MAG: hypothetical protein COY66_02420 [Candidatus Kerfeldbacteria bacterium CG_4_10_14_0_8_um_filter_42_10]|uniref:Glycosyltransferase RgtA/B/C/D-like domain-containing protein n=1 Tax=Candidatus Kerfeldbacteria bacterium CG_4_10_14_0_8_um_filter_42_10 TaxID=2014248 RepID=A0A2M7RK85_9BACT|nr:MAG: hypothetical protein COY66_02420 [Candidatus Kerfeldbacteria bacterium CG_4_10_14_0_8_um_filter_42_10]
MFFKSIFHQKPFSYFEKPLIGYLVIFLIAFGVFFYIQYTPDFPDPDSFYHMKMGLLIQEGNLARNFPWLSDYTILGGAYTDQHFLYHVFLIPFLAILSPAIGIKVATIFLGAFLIAGFYWFLKQEKIRLAWLYSLLLLFIEPFTFRISLAKAPSVSIIFLFMVLWCVFNYRPKLLFVISAVFVWAYGGFPLTLVVAATYGVISIAFHFQEKRNGVLNKLFRHRPALAPLIAKGKELKLFLAALGGILTGLVINPYFPQNLPFYWSQLVEIGIVNYQKIIGVGGEWYPYQFNQLVPNAVFLFLILITALVVFFITIRKQSRRSFVLLILTLFFLVLTLKSRRYVEYFVPFGMMFGAFAIHPLIQKIDFRSLFKKVTLYYFSKKVVFTILAVYFLVAVPTIVLRDLKQEHNSFGSGLRYDKFQAASTWLKNNTSAGSLVLHSDWDEFPILFYHNTHNHYIVGLDPTFMYKYSQDLYWKWVHITTGEESNDLYDIIKNDFQSATVFLEKDHTAMDNNFKNDSHFQLVYEDQEAKIYQIKE